MKRQLVLPVVVVALVVLIVVWASRNMTWTEITVPAMYKGEALTNPLYGAKRLVEQLGGRGQWDRVLTDPPTDGVIVLTAWHWNLVEDRRERLERWVEDGGRLVVDRSLVGGEAIFEAWSGIAQQFPPEDEDEDAEDEESNPFPGGSDRKLRRIEGGCRKLHETTPDASAAARTPLEIELCERATDYSQLVSKQPVTWSLSDEVGMQVLRVAVGKGTVTVINAVPFRTRQLFEGDHAKLFVMATQLRPGDKVHFLSEERHPSILVLAWIYGWPVVLLLAGLIALALWRNGARFGPLEAVADRARRSLAEQIRGTGQFAIRFGGGRSLHAATVRALEEAARRHIARYERLTSVERIEAIARMTALEASAIAAAMNFSGLHRAHDLRDALALLETARRRLLLERSFGQKGSIHGNRVEHDHARG